jgi:DnaJ-class molecular chaperone
MDLQRAFKILEIDQGASLAQIKEAYRDLAFVWHPDRHADSPRLRQKASEKMKELNAAYDCICAYYSSKIFRKMLVNSKHHQNPNL